jgi:XTP/dITP diphosphohydrolase
MKKEICLATNNPGKLKEYREMLSPLGFLVYCPKDLNIESEPEETGTTYFENAYIKAKALALKVPFPVIADDSGFEVKALGNFPGLHSSRFAATFGNDYQKAGADLIARLKPSDSRAAEFHCVICLLENPTAKPRYFEGICKGTLLYEAHGNHGFGYDPFFHCEEANADFGVVSEDIKNQYSHRSKALAKLLTYLAI